jgi:Fic family protein
MISIIPHSDPSSLGEYQDKIVELYMADAALNQTIPDSIRQPTEWLLRLVNCYYSNKIEGNPTHPKELLKTQEGGPTDGQDITKSVLELLVHLEAQIKAKVSAETVDSVTSRDYIKSIHQSFYAGLSDDKLVVRNKDGDIALDEDGEPIKVIPGEFRERDVRVGNHIPPGFTDVPGQMRWIEDTFQQKKIHGTTKVIAAAGLHHRLAWIHPFLDGNGRAIRLVTDCYMRGAGFGGYGLWSITRGFGRDTTSYYKALARADMARQGQTDGRGILSDKGLLDFTKYFIDTALDQVKFFTELLEPRKLGIRVDYYFEMRAKGGLPGTDGKNLPILKIAARDIYRLLLEKGAMSRSAVCQHLDKGEQTLRPILKQMDDEGLISAKPKQDIEIKLSTTAVEFLFPQIW